MTAQNKTKKNRQKQRKVNQFRLLTLKFLKISFPELYKLHLRLKQRRAEGQWLEEQVNVLKLRCS
jgi:hypothetical protein